MRTAGKLALLSSLYFSQGMPYGFFFQAVPVFMRKQGFSLAQIGLSAVLTLPWALKFLWAPLVDQHHIPSVGRRRSWILPLQLAAAAALALMALSDGRASITLLMAAMLATNMLAATQDIATDALAVDLLEPEERGLANGIQVAGYRLGMIFGGGLMLVVLDTLGWMSAFGAMAAMLLVATIPIALHREAPGPPPEKATWPHEPIVELLRRPGMAEWLGVVAVYKAGEAFAGAMLRPFLVDLGLTLTQIGAVTGTVAFSAGLVGALAGGALVQVLGRRRALYTFGVLQSLAVAGFIGPAVLHTASVPLLVVVCAVEHLASGMATATLFTAMMDFCREETAATDYTVQASVQVIATGLAATVSGWSAQAVGYPVHFGLAASISLAAVALLAVLVAAGRVPLGAKEG